MSAPIVVKRDGRNPEWPFRWECPECENRADEAPSFMDLLSMPESMGYGNTIAEAADAGRKHLREVHDEAEAVAKYARDTTPDWEYLRSLAHKAPRVRRQVSNYCRVHGCHRGECGCGCIKTPKPPESGSDFVPTISAARIGGDARTQIHICTKCGLVSTCNRQPNGARA